MKIPFCGQSYTDRTQDANAQRSVNLYPMKSPTAQDPNRIVMYPTPGYSLYFNLPAQVPGSGAIRGFFEINDVLYMVSGKYLVKMTAAGVFTNVGTLATSTGRCSIVSNNVELAISDGSNGYVYNLTSGAFTVISGGAWPATGGVTNFTFMDSYVLASLNGSRQIIQSDLLAAGIYGAQAFARVTSYADNNVAIFSDQLQLYIFGPKLTEVRFNAASVPFAFQKVSGVLIQAGCAAKDTIVKVGSTVMWLAADSAGKAFVAALEGYNPKVVSTAPINEILERYATVSDAFAYTYREGDSQFYCITFPTEDATWVYDLRMGMWHERSIGGGRDLPDCCANFNGKHIAGDASGNLWLMSQDYSLDNNGDGLSRVRTCQHIDAEGMTIFLHELQVDIQSGVGTLSGQGQDPLATLEISRDGGNTWTNVGTASMGLMGEYRRRLIWRNLGGARMFTFRLTITDPVATYILGATARATKGAK